MGIVSPAMIAYMLGVIQDDAQAKPIPGLPAQSRYDLQGEATFIGQGAPSFSIRYSGPSSFPSKGVMAATETATLYLGARPIPNVELYVNPEIAIGTAPGNGLGLGGYTNGDLIGQPVESNEIYLARAFARWRIPLRQGKDQPVGREDVGRAPNIIAGPIPQHRLVVTAGKLAATDIFDYNAYANNARTQFINNAFVNNLAYDYAEDARGYDYGAAVTLVNPNYAVRVGSFAMPSDPGSRNVTFSSGTSHGEQIELDLNPQVLRKAKPPMTVRILGFRNVGFMGNYRDAVNSAQVGTVPNLGQVRQGGAVRTGLSVNLEQGIADGGNTGLFARAGWADGNVEAAGYAEADEAFSIGAQISGTHWKRATDMVGVALGANGISQIHQQYLQAGGQGLTLGDGNLRYGAESIAEMYYLFQVRKNLQFTGDVQWIANPGFNQERGPIPVFSVRARYSF